MAFIVKEKNIEWKNYKDREWKNYQALLVSAETKL